MPPTLVLEAGLARGGIRDPRPGSFENVNTPVLEPGHQPEVPWVKDTQASPVVSHNSLEKVSRRNGDRSTNASASLAAQALDQIPDRENFCPAAAGGDREQSGNVPDPGREHVPLFQSPLPAARGIQHLPDQPAGLVLHQGSSA